MMAKERHNTETRKKIITVILSGMGAIPKKENPLRSQRKMIPTVTSTNYEELYSCGSSFFC
jgi:hypothetical protein